MQCPKCLFDNPEGAKFCNECGARLDLTCPSCTKINPPGSKFCNECGQTLSGPQEPHQPKSPHEKWPQPSPLPLPKELSEKILAQKGRIEGERRQVTVMFCDLEGSTTLTERLGDEKAFSLIDQIFGILTKQVQKYEGTVQEFRGDGIMALFGAPIALENAAQRAIRSALAIHQEVTKFSHQVGEGARGTDIRLRIGIHTGPVVLGTIGSDLRLEFQVIGDTVNLAARMESLAEPGTTYVTEDTFKLTEGFFRFEGLGEKVVKGKETPVRVYRVIAPSSQSTRFDVSAEQGLTPFVGRQRELELLLDGYERAKSGKGQAFSLISEAGVGKSRLLYEFRKAVSNEEITFLEGRCLSYSRDVPYHPFISILKANFEIKEGQNDSEIRRKVERGLDLIGLDRGSSLPYFLELLSVKDSGIDQIPLSPEGKKDRLQEAFRRIILKGSQIRPLVIAIEDLQWMDKSSEEALKYILESIPGSRILSIFTYRPEFIPSWGGKSFHSQLTLQRLSNRETLDMAAHLLGTREMERSLEELLLEKTEGIPFFLEEFIHSLKDLKIIQQRGLTYGLSKGILEKMSVPTTIQEVILARVDPLPARAKEVLQAGSVIEREFDFRLIKEATGLPEPDLLSNLSLLKDAELLYERGIYPQSSYIFKHALTREVVYDSILSDRKKKLHDEIGQAMETLYQDRLGEYYGVLSGHFIKSGHYEKGGEYAKWAAKKAEKTVSLNDAISYMKNRISCLEKLPPSEEVDKEEIDARTIMGLYIFQMNYPVQAKEAIDPIIERALKMNYKRRLPPIHSILGQHAHEVEENFSKAFNHLEEALRVSGETNDILSLFFANYSLGLALMLDCAFEKAIFHFKIALEMNQAANNLWGISAVKSYLAYIDLCLGNINLGSQVSEEALRMAEDSGDIYSKAIAYNVQGVSYMYKGIPSEAEKHFLKGIEFGERINFFIWNYFANFFLGEMYHHLQDYEKAIGCFEKAIGYLEKVQFGPSWINACRIGIARAKVMRDQRDINLEILYGYVQGNKIKILDRHMRRSMAEVLLHMDNKHWDETESWFNQAIEADQRNQMRWFLAWDYLPYSDLLKKKGDGSKAKEILGRAIETFKDCGADGWVERYEKELAILA